jgi:hypothetical protein
MGDLDWASCRIVSHLKQISPAAALIPLIANEPEFRALADR